MTMPATRCLNTINDIDAALRREILGSADHPGNPLPIVAVTSEEHGPLVVMRADDMALVLGFMQRRKPVVQSLS